MRRDIAVLWVDALRSGKYKQTRDVLHRKGEGHCCLGVLCELAVEEGVIPPPVNGIAYGDDGEVSELPEEVMDWAALDSANPHLVGEDGDDDAASAYNDDHGYSFDRIAAAVERTYLPVKRGDWVLMAIGSWYKGSYVDLDREVKGKVLWVETRTDSNGEPMTVARVWTRHGQRPNGCQRELTVEKRVEDLKHTTPEED